MLTDWFLQNKTKTKTVASKILLETSKISGALNSGLIWDLNSTPRPRGLGHHPSIKKLWIFHVQFLTIFNAWTYLTRFIASVSDSKVFTLAPWPTVWPTSGVSEAWKDIQISNRINFLNRKKTEWKITEKQKNFNNILIKSKQL